MIAARWRGLARRRRLLAVGLALPAAWLALWVAVPVVEVTPPLSTALIARDGRLLGATVAADQQWRFGPPSCVPDHYRQALVQFEDRRFDRHVGLDPLAIGRAAWQNLRAGEVVSGGSTITMQVVRLSRPGRPRNLGEKLIEALLALRLEMARSKDQIIALYATHAPYGGNVVGLDAASWRYFGREPASLSWAEAALLAVLPNNPGLLHPGRHRDRLRARRDGLLDHLHERGCLDDVTWRLALAEPLPPRPLPLPQLAPHLLARVAQGVGRVATTVDADLQRAVYGLVDRHQRTLGGAGIHNAAALVAEVRSGQVLAYVGNVTPDGPARHGQWVDLTAAPRSTGSLLKPLLFAAMVQAGEVLPRQLVADIPTHFGSYQPENYGRTYTGAVPASTALARSLNVPAVRMLASHGVDRFADLVRRLGLTTLHRPAQDYGLTLIIGGAEGSLWELAGVYAGLARTALAPAGAVPGPRPLQLTVAAPPAAPPPPLGPGACYLTLRALVETERPGADGAWRRFEGAPHVAWKTGTSSGHRDAWAVGVTPDHVVAVWVGNASGEGAANLTGHQAAAPLLFALQGLLPGGQAFPAPWHDLREVTVCAASGMLAGPDCVATRPELVPRAMPGGDVCAFCQRVHTDRSGRWRLLADCAPLSEVVSTSRFVLPPAMEGPYRQHHRQHEPLPPWHPDCELAASAEATLECVYPPAGAAVAIPRELAGDLGRMVCEAVHRRPGARIFWHLDDRYLGQTRDLHQMALAPEPGAHVLTLIDEHGEVARRRFTVVEPAR